MSTENMNGARSKTAEDISRDENNALKQELNHMVNKVASLEYQLRAAKDGITKHCLEKEYLKGKADAYESIFANHNLSLYAKD